MSTTFIEIDECLSVPCMWNSTCNDEIDGYKCNCTSGYNGTHCESGKLKYHTSRLHTFTITKLAHLLNYFQMVFATNNNHIVSRNK